MGLLYRQIVIALLPDFNTSQRHSPQHWKPEDGGGFPTHKDHHRSDFRANSFNCVYYL
ncbi:MAG: hypothetical protein DSM106950_31365 [Stigonema ocellatum SAG 48.90 = DSM 106950]|nr:hypothetical protein [Stigonema ocellatum SAG 48.90 = DSM 106950]